MGAPEHWDTPWLRDRVVETSLAWIGTPVIVLPAEPRLAAVRHAVLGWKPSPEATRAVHDLVHLCDPRARIDVVIATDSEGDPAASNGDEVRRHLVRHGFEVVIHTVPLAGDSEAEAIHGFALDARADLLAVGGFGHSRVREVVLGGVTRELVRTPALPVMFSH